MFFFNDTNIYIRVLNRFGFSYLSMQSGLGWALYIISSYHFLDLGSMVNRTWDHSSSTTSLIYWTSKFSAPKKEKKNGSSISFSCLFFSALYIPSLCSHLFFEKYLLWVFLIQKWVFAHRKSWKKNFKLFDIFFSPLLHLFSYENRGKKRERCLVELTFTLLGLVAPLEGKARRSKRKEAPTFCCWYTCASPSITRHIRTSIVCL